MTRVVGATAHPYALPLVRPWVAARTTLAVRRGLLLALTAEDGTVGWGDCAPLPSSGAAGHARVFDAVGGAARTLAGRDTGVLLADESDLSPVPEVRWAIETALFDLEARRAGLPLCQYLLRMPSERVRFERDARRVAVNAALGQLDAGCADRAEAAVTQGFAVGKIKVGVGAIDEERRALDTVVERTQGRLWIRLDANRAWPEADARRVLDSLIGLPIDGVEEPLADPTPAVLARLQADLPFPLAVDESLPVLGGDALLEAGAVRRLVVKPARVGGIRATLELAIKAQAAGTDVLLTSVVDSAVGVAAAAHLAAALPVEGDVHGLATLDWLARDVASPPAIVDGALILPAGPGLGLVPEGQPAQG